MSNVGGGLLDLLRKRDDALCREAADTIEKLSERLEISPDHSYDGIACRDETIRMLEQERDELRTDSRRLDWIAKAADAQRVEIARSLLGTGYEIAEWPSMRVAVTGGSLRAAIDAAMGEQR